MPMEYPAKGAKSIHIECPLPGNLAVVINIMVYNLAPEIKLQPYDAEKPKTWTPGFGAQPSVA